MIYVWISLAAWLGTGTIVGARSARVWYAKALEEAIETRAEHDRKRKMGWHDCKGYNYGYYSLCYSAQPTRPDAVVEWLKMALLWPIKGTAFIASKTFSLLGKASFGGVEKKIKEDLNAKWELEKVRFFQSYTKQFEDLAFSYRMITTYREAVRHNNKVGDLRDSMIDDKSRPSLATKEAVDLALGAYRYDEESLVRTLQEVIA